MKERVKAIEDVREADMVRYKFNFTYSAIVLRWCIGYLGKAQLVDFLKRAKFWLKEEKRRLTR